MVYSFIKENPEQFVKKVGERINKLSLNPAMCKFLGKYGALKLVNESDSLKSLPVYSAFIDYFSQTCEAVLKIDNQLESIAEPMAEFYKCYKLSDDSNINQAMENLSRATYCLNLNEQFQYSLQEIMVESGNLYDIDFKRYEYCKNIDQSLYSGPFGEQIQGLDSVFCKM